MWDKLKKRWNVNTGWDVVIILIVFACTGFSILYIKRILFGWVGISPEETEAWIRWTANILIILPLYQVVLLFWGFVFGKFSFFWEFEKRMFSRIAGIGKSRKNN